MTRHVKLPSKASAIAACGIAAIVSLALVLPTAQSVSGCVRSEVWPRSLLALTIAADALVAVAYAWIPITLLGVWRRRRDVHVSWTLAAFAAFIVLCGMTHVMGIVTAFRPLYWLAAEVEVATAAVSLVTAYLLQTRVGPLLLTLKSYGDVVADRDAARGESAELQAAHARLELALADVEIGKVSAEELAEELRGAKAEADAARRRAEEGEQRALGGEADAVAGRQRLEEAFTRIGAQDAAIRELSTPILHLWSGVVMLPIVGTVDPRRAADMTEALLGEIERTGARFAIVDVTGVGVMDTGTVAHLAGMARAASLMGSTSVFTGIRPDVAQTLVASGVEVGGVQTLRSLEQGLRWCLARLDRKA